MNRVFLCTDPYKENSQRLISKFANETSKGTVDRPLVQYEEVDGFLTVSCLGIFRQDGVKFFYEMISRWLLPGKKVTVEGFFSSRFKFFELEKDSYFVAEIVLSLENERWLEQARINLPPLLREVEIGLGSLYHAKRILEIKGHSNDEKTAVVQGRITELLHRFPKLFDYDIFPLMQRYLISVSEQYKKSRSPHLLSRIVSTIYVFTQRLLSSMEKTPRKRHLFIKVTRSSMQTPFGAKKTLGFFVGLNFLKENELFDKRHLFKAAQKYFPDISMIEESHFAHSVEEGKLFVFYVEMEKNGKEGFTDKEILFLQKELESDLAGCIESLVRPIFMPRNEEEVLKYVVILSNQITLVRDLPQIVIIFDEQTDRDLLFTVVLVRPLLPDSLSLEELLAGRSEFSVEKIRQGGLIRKKFPKEAAVLKVRLSNTPFLRDDFAVDLFRARQKLVEKLEVIFGEVRDYNGGMISKQMEVLHSFQEVMQKGGEKNAHLLENFFHSLYPVELRSVVHLDCLKILYQLFQKVLFGEEEMVVKREHRSVYLCLKIHDLKRVKLLLETINKIQIPTNQLVRLSLPIHEHFFLGFIFFSDSETQQEMFLEMISEKLLH